MQKIQLCLRARIEWVKDIDWLNIGEKELAYVGLTWRVTWKELSIAFTYFFISGFVMTVYL